MKPQLILIAGPYRSGTNGDPHRIAGNLLDWNAPHWRFISAALCL
jgi:hypothetical protein